jgi:hypothetical protein
VDELIKPDWDKARQIIRNWMASRECSLRKLAKLADIQPSVVSRFLNYETTLEMGSILKLYVVLKENMNPLDRRAFLQIMGLLPLALTLSQDLLVVTDPLDNKLTSPGTPDLGMRLLSQWP